MEDGEYERFLESLSKPDEDDFSNELVCISELKYIIWLSNFHILWIILVA